MRTRRRTRQNHQKCYIHRCSLSLSHPLFCATQKLKYKTKTKMKREWAEFSPNRIQLKWQFQVFFFFLENLLYRTDLGVRDDDDDANNEEGWKWGFRLCWTMAESNPFGNMRMVKTRLLRLHFQTRNYNGTANFVYRIDDIIAILMAAIKKMNFQAIVWNSLWKKRENQAEYKSIILYYTSTPSWMRHFIGFHNMNIV